jgi:2,4-dienoyl-CoA reductase (NADPH2)
MEILPADPLAGLLSSIARSAVRTRISPSVSIALDAAGIDKQLSDFAAAEHLARQVGDDGLEMIGSARYLQAAPAAQGTNQRNQSAPGPLWRRLRRADALRGGSVPPHPVGREPRLHPDFCASRQRTRLNGAYCRLE